jgi:ligand-binding sensor domain-containing protein
MGDCRNLIARVISGVFLLTLCNGALRLCGAAPDRPFPQPVSEKHTLPPEFRGKVRELCVDRDGIVYIRTDLGVARLFDGQIRLDQSYRPLIGKIARDLTVADGKLYYLFPDEVLSNRDAGKFVRKLSEDFQSFAVNARNEVLLVQGKKLARLRQKEVEVLGEAPAEIKEVVSNGESFFVITASGAYDGVSLREIAHAEGITAATFHRGGLVIGTTNGFLIVDPKSSATVLPLQRRLPAVNITSLASDGTNLWAGTTQGIWRRAEDGAFRYFASRRWLDQDAVIDIALDPSGNLYALTQTGLNLIEFKSMTLADKARWYDEKIRSGTYDTGSARNCG